MATASEEQKFVIEEKFLTCEICTEYFRRAKNLPCGHTFCQTCLEEWAKRNRGRGSRPTCPNCREPWPSPVSDLPTNYRINSMVDTVLGDQTERIDSSDTYTHHATDPVSSPCQQGFEVDFPESECQPSLASSGGSSRQESSESSWADYLVGAALGAGAVLAGFAVARSFQETGEKSDSKSSKSRQGTNQTRRK